MSFFKTASADILGYSGSKTKVSNATLDKFTSWDGYRTDDGFLYVRVRAISSRVNKNWDGWPSDELSKAYRTFVGKPLFVDHQNHDPGRARGVVVDAMLHVDKDKSSKLDPYYATAPDNHKPPTWVELLLEVDAKSFPRLAKAIIAKDIDGVSMGANVAYTECSHCRNRAEDPMQFCSHILNKGALYDFKLPNGHKTSKNSYEDCYDIGFFELSFVFDPADETALVRDIKHAKTAGVRAAVVAEAADRHMLSDAFGGLDYRDYLNKIAQDAWEKALLKPAPDPESNAWNAVMMAVKRAGFPHDAADVANDMREKFQAQSAPVEAMPEEQRGYDQPFAFNPMTEVEDIHPTLMEMSMDVPNNRANPNLSHTKTAQNPVPQADLTSVPDDVNTLREEKACPLCGNSIEDGQCPTCGFENPPEGLDNPDLTKANPDLQNVIESAPVPQPEQPPQQPPMNAVPSGGMPPNGQGQGGTMGVMGAVDNSRGQFKVEAMQNGYVRIDDRQSGLVGLYNPDGSYRNGDLRLAPDDVLSLMGSGHGVMGSIYHFGTVYVDNTITLNNERIAADQNDLSGGRINTRERPLLPITRQVSDRPKNQKTVSDSAKPVQSNTKKEN